MVLEVEGQENKKTPIPISGAEWKGVLKEVTGWFNAGDKSEIASVARLGLNDVWRLGLNLAALDDDKMTIYATKYSWAIPGFSILERTPSDTHFMVLSAPESGQGKWGGGLIYRVAPSDYLSAEVFQEAV